MTGKSLDKKYANNSNAPIKTIKRCVTPQEFFEKSVEFVVAKDNFYRQYYFRNPCVPIDFESVNEALRHCSRTKADIYPLHEEERFYSDEGSVCLMPGTYRERITIYGAPLVEGQPLRSVTIRAAFPSVGASLVHYERRIRSVNKNQSAICISTCGSGNDSLEERGIVVKISHLQILHSTPGADIWGGNTAILIDGPRAQVFIDSCKIRKFKCHCLHCLSSL
jgi:hypothetical protein